MTPAVLGVQTASSPPRYASGTKLREATRAPVESVPLGEAGPMLPIVSLEPIKAGSAETLGASPKGGRRDARPHSRGQGPDQRRHMKVLVCAEARRNQLDRLFYELLTAARSVAEEARSSLCGSGVTTSAKRADGQRRPCLPATDPRFVSATADIYATALHRAIEAEKPDLRSLAIPPPEWISGPKPQPASASRWPPMSWRSNEMRTAYRSDRRSMAAR